MRASWITRIAASCIHRMQEAGSRPTDGLSTENRRLSLATAATSSSHRSGRVVHWDPILRRGTLEDVETAERLDIANARAFESVLPTHLKGGMEGATVMYQPATEAESTDRVIVRNRLDRVTAKSYQTARPVDFIEIAARSELFGGTGTPSPSTGTTTAAAATSSPPLRFAKSIIVTSLSENQLARCDGPLVEGFANLMPGSETAVPPPKHLKDMRSSKLFDATTNEWLIARRRLGSAEAADAFVEMKTKKAEEERLALRREVLQEGCRGVVMTWSPLHRTGVVRVVTDEEKGEEELVEAIRRDALTVPVGPRDQQSEGNVAYIRSAQCFHSAFPSSRDLRGRVVTFDRVVYSSQPHTHYAEGIRVEKDEDEFKVPLEELKAELPRVNFIHEAVGVRRYTTATGTSQDSVTPAAAPEEGAEPLRKSSYGVITRWSGGQGVIQSSDQQSYHVTSGAAFNQLVDLSSHTLRGAVVSFQHNEGSCVAEEIDVLCLANDAVADVKPLMSKKPQPVTPSEEEWRRFTAGGPSPADGEQQDGAVADATHPDAGEEARWIAGTVVSWSAAEGSGILQGTEDEVRYVLRDVASNVTSKDTLHRLTVGRRVKFMSYGSSGRLACNVQVLEEEADEEEMAAQRLEKESDDQPEEPAQEAIVSPTSTSYWLKRMEKAGYDVAEVSAMQDKALTPPDDDEDDKFLDSEDLFKKDHWWTDPRKNKKFPNSKMTTGHLAMMGPASMMNMAAKARDPKRLDKMVKKYQGRLTEDQKAMAWEKAKEMAPKYEACIRRAREKNEEPSFHFF